jgi:hypothetical protein
MEQYREVLKRALTQEYLELMAKQGWQPVSIEWQREVESGKRPQEPRLVEEIPYGLRVSNDCLHLEQHPEEIKVLVQMMELLIADRPLSQVAAELNQAGYRTRSGAGWTAIGVFDMLPRLVEAGPQIFSSEEWIERRRVLYQKILAISA